MSVRIGGIAVVARIDAIASRYPGGLTAYEADASWAVTCDESLVAVSCADSAEARSWIDRAVTSGIAAEQFVVIDALNPQQHAPWLTVQPVDAEIEISLNAAHSPAQRFDELSRSDSGLHYVRERRGGLMRVLTDSELADFNDPPPCPECAEQFGCEHFNVAREPLLSDADVDAEVPQEWSAFAKEYGVSRADIERLQRVERVEGEYRLMNGAQSDMRMLELVLLLNDAR
jgi:hypothetical protein